MNFIKAQELTRRYGRDESAVLAITGVSFGVEAGEFVAVMGESGSGKSTLLSIMGGLNTPTSGTYIVDGTDVYGLGTDQRADFRREFIGFVFQSFQLLPYLSLVENTMLPLATRSISRRQKRDMALEALARVDLSDKASRLPGQISGGEQERAAVARAVVNQPPLLLADEPTGNLDSKTSHELMDLLTELNEGGMTIVMVTHSPESANFARRVLKVHDGRLANGKSATA